MKIGRFGDIDAATWARLSALLDEALDMDVAERDRWLQQLPPDEVLSEPLRHLLSGYTGVKPQGFFKSPDFALLLDGNLPLQHPAPELRDGGTVGAYRLLREIGRGGMSSVWLADRIDGRFQRQVALKFPYVGGHQKQLAERMARERDILARLEHPHIARLYDADVTPQGAPYLVLEYVDGIPLTAYCDEQRLHIRERLVLFLQVLNAVQYAHSRLVIHRDLKPTNILVTKSRAARLLDFGIAKLISDSETESAITQLGGRMLTPGYASPEQITGRPITTASDIYSLGVLLFELLTGARPYRLKHESAASLEVAIVEADILAPSRVSLSASAAEQRSTSRSGLLHSLRGDLDAIVCRALRKEPEARYRSADALAQDIGHWLDGEVVEARRPSALYSTYKLIRRNRLLFGSLAAVLVSLVVGAAVALSQARQAIAQTERLQATKNFLIDVFNANSKQQHDPLKAQQTTAREMLDRASERLLGEQKPSDVLEEMLGILGGLYLDLGLDDRSVALRRRAVQVSQQLHGRDDPRTAQAEVDYADALWATDQWHEALAPLQDAERILDRHDDRLSRTRARQLISMTQYLRGIDRDRAREYSRRAIALTREKYRNSPDHIEALRTGALIESEVRNHPAAVVLLEEAVAAEEAAKIAEIDLVRPLTELGEQQGELLQYATAEANFQRALEITRRLNGDAHIDTIQVRMRFAELLRDSGRLLESEQMLQTAERDALTSLGEQETFHLPTVRDQLARTEHALGNFAVAGDLYRRAIAARESTRSGTRQHANMLVHQAQLLTDMGHAEESERLATRAIGYYEHAGVPTGSTTVPVVLSAAFRALHRKTEALEILDRYAQGREMLNTKEAVELELQRAEALAAVGAVDRAEALARQQIARLVDLPQRQYLRLLEASARAVLGRLLLERGLAAEARDQLETALGWREGVLSSHSPVLAENQALLAKCLWMLGDTANSRSMLRQAQATDALNTELGDDYREPLRAMTLALSSPPEAVR
jgi:serine/threonine-protein kinase